MTEFLDGVIANPGMFAAIGLYLLLMVLIGLWSRRVAARVGKQRSGARGFMEEYFLAGRSMGGVVLAMSIVTTYTSASSFIGGPGVAYTLGLGWVLLAMIQVPTTFLTLGLLGRRMAAYSRRTGALTVSDFLRHRYKSETLVGLTSMFMLVFFMAVMLAQFIGGARLFQAATGTPYSVGLLLFGLTVVLYTTLGGFRAVVLTDLAQGFIMLFAAVAVLWGVIDAGGGLTAISGKLEAINPGLLRPTGADDGIAVPFLMSFWVLVGLGVLGLPQTAQKCMAFKDDKSLRDAMVIGTVVIGFTLLCTHLAGALGRAVMPGLPAGDLIMPTLIVRLMPPFLAGVFIAGVLAAIMSTVSSMLIMSSATLIRDLYIEWRLKGDADLADQRFVRRASLGITGFIGIAVFILALYPPDLLVWINLFAFGGLEAVFLWPLLLGLYWEKADATGALYSVIVGVTVFMAIYIGKPPIWNIHPIVPSLIAAGLAFYLGNGRSPAKSERR